MGSLELQWEYALRGEDAEEHLHALLDLLDPTESLIHPALDPGWDVTNFAWAIGIRIRQTVNSKDSVETPGTTTDAKSV